MTEVPTTIDGEIKVQYSGGIHWGHIRRGKEGHRGERIWNDLQMHKILAIPRIMQIAEGMNVQDKKMQRKVDTEERRELARMSVRVTLTTKRKHELWFIHETFFSSQFSLLCLFSFLLRTPFKKEELVAETLLRLLM